MLNSVGDIKDPCNTPFYIRIGSEFNWIFVAASVYINSIAFIMSIGTFRNWSFCSRILWFTESNAYLRSKNRM